MKKIYMFLITMLLGIALTGCSFGTETTTTEEIIVDTETYIEIDSVEDLEALEMDKSYILTTDLDLSGIEWIPVGTYSEPFRGNFDGDGYTISNLTITEASENFNGLFGYVYGDIFDLNITSVNIDYETDFLTYAGGLAAFALGDITNVTVEGDITIVNSVSNCYVGLLIGYTQPDINTLTDAADFDPNDLTNNSVIGSISVDSQDIAYVGGLVGKTFNTQVTDNYSEVDLDVTLNNSMGYIGGFIGHNFGGLIVNYVEQVNDVNVYIQNNVSISTISVSLNDKNASIGGFIGYNHFGYNSDNYSKTNISLSGSALETTVINLGGYFGENWSSQMINNVTYYSYTEALTVDFDLRTDTFVTGGNYSTYEFVGNYILSDDLTLDVSEIEELDLLTNADLTNDFFTNTLEWEASQINKIQD